MAGTLCFVSLFASAEQNTAEPAGSFSSKITSPAVVSNLNRRGSPNLNTAKKDPSPNNFTHNYPQFYPQFAHKKSLTKKSKHYVVNGVKDFFTHNYPQFYPQFAHNLPTILPTICPQFTHNFTHNLPTKNP